MGVDYGLGKYNIDLKRGIRYSAINGNKISGESLNDFEPYYIYNCPECGKEFNNEFVDFCPDCQWIFSDTEFDNLETDLYIYDKDGYCMEYNSNTNDITILRSPYYGYFDYCSPCFPGGTYLDGDFDENTGVKGYCLPIGFFDEYSPMPYKEYHEVFGTIFKPEKLFSIIEKIDSSFQAGETIDGDKLIIAGWNNEKLTRIQNTFEKMDYLCSFDDEYYRCDNCYKFIPIHASHAFDHRHYVWASDCEIVCENCVDIDALEYNLNSYLIENLTVSHSPEITSILKENGYKLWGKKDSNDYDEVFRVVSLLENRGVNHIVDDMYGIWLKPKTTKICFICDDEEEKEDMVNTFENQYCCDYCYRNNL